MADEKGAAAAGSATSEEDYSKMWAGFQVKDGEIIPPPIDDDKNEDKGDGGAGGDDQDLSEDDAGKKASDDKSKDHGGIESLEKALNDTKSHATKLQQQIADKDRIIEELRQATKSGTDKEVTEKSKKAREAIERIKETRQELYAEFPEFQGVLDSLLDASEFAIEESDRLRTQLKGTGEDAEKLKAIKYFEENILPRVAEKHTDASMILKNKVYWEWVEEQSPMVQYGAKMSNDPRDIIAAISEFKKSKNADKIEALRESKKRKQDEIINNSQTLRGGSMGIPPNPNLDDSNKSYDELKVDALKILERQGLYKPK